MGCVISLWGGTGLAQGLLRKPSSWKKRFPEIRLLRLRPYPLHGAACIPKGEDGVIAPPGFADLPVALALARADLYMLRHSSFLIAYAPQPELHVQEVLAFARQMQAHGLLHLTELHSPR